MVASGRKFRTLSVVDTYSRECLIVEANTLTLVELSARTGLGTKLLGHARQELGRI